MVVGVRCEVVDIFSVPRRVQGLRLMVKFPLLVRKFTCSDEVKGYAGSNVAAGPPYFAQDRRSMSRNGPSC